MSKLKVLAMCVGAVVLFLNLSIAQAEDDSEYVKNEYAKRLERVLVNVNAESNKSLAQMSYDQLLSFSKRYPKSRFADDAKYMLWMTEYLGITMRPQKDLPEIDRQILRMEGFVKDYPDGKIEDITIGVLKKVMGNQAGGLMVHISYKYLIEYMKANKAFVTGDYPAVVELYSSLKKELSDVIENDAASAAEIYIPLWLGLKKQGRSAELNRLYDEVYLKYPGTQLEAIFKKYQQKENAPAK